MDPSIEACRDYNSFQEKPPLYRSEMLPTGFSSTPGKSLDNIKIEYENFNVNYCNKEKFDELLNLEDQLNNDEEARSRATEQLDPFSKLGTSIFMSMDAIILANMDAIFKFTGHYSSLLKQRLETTYEKVGEKEVQGYGAPLTMFEEDRNFTFTLIGDSPGGFAQYLQYRVIRNRAYVMTPEHQGLDFNGLNTKYFYVTNGEDGTGDIIRNREYFIDLVRKRIPGGVHLFFANGEDIYYSTGEIENTRLLLNETIINMACNKEGGNFVLKMFDTVTDFSAQLLFIISQCYELLILFKPVSSQITTPIKYAIGLKRRPDATVDTYIDILRKVEKSYSTDSLTGELRFVSSFLEKPLPEDFRIWLSKQNNYLIDSQLEFNKSVKDVLNGFEVITPKYNTSKALKIWSIPGDLPPEYS
jgi:hypothetical protein